MVRLRIKEVAEAQGLSLAAVQREAKLSMSTARRYWYSSRSGLERDSGTLREVNLFALKTIAGLLGVRPGELLIEN